MKASELIDHLERLKDEHGDLSVLVAIEDVGAEPADPPYFDSDGDGDDCFLL